MKMPTNGFRLSNLTIAVMIGLSATSALAADEQDAAEEEEQVIEEVVTVGTRLKGTAAAVLEERKQQAFVADILGAEQISRSGDSDAASALRRVTGLTLVDGKFIYVRGLGERYSSTQLNGATVPSPDPTRSVIPLDLFPSQIIESLSVQKSFSPSMPASFGGGNVNIRTKSIPNDFIFNVQAKVGTDSENWDDGLQYDDGSTAWYGRDSGTRGAPESLHNLWSSRTFLNDISIEENRQIALDINRNYDPTFQSVDPDMGLKATLGNYYDFDETRVGFLAVAGYDNEWDVAEEYQGEDFRQAGDDWEFVRGWDKVDSTEHSVRWSGMLNLGMDYDRTHKIDVSLMALNDTRDQVRDKYGNSNNILLEDGQRIRSFDVIYEERELLVNQIKGKHTFPEWWYIGLDWQYSDARSSRKAPGNMESRFIIEDDNEDGIFDLETEAGLTNATTAARYSFQELHDKVRNFGYNVSLPLELDQWEIELKVGGDFVEKARNSETRRFDINARALSNFDLSGHRMSDILSDDAIANATLNQRLLRDTTIAGDDYISATKVDAGYFEADLFFDGTWRFSGGIRYEDFRQVVVPIVPQTGDIDLPSDATPQDLLDLTFQEDDFYPSLAITYVMDNEMQFRFSYGETVVRPDVREVSPSTYIDPITEFPIGGTPGLSTTAIDNYDFRWEWYRESGDSLSIGLFYKDMDAPIESVQSPAQDGPPLIRIANAETGEVYGIEFDFMQSLGFLGEVGNDFFVSGNVTLSDSEIVLDSQSIVEQTGVSTAVTNLTRRLTGHSEYVVNFQLGFDSPNGEHAATLVYNVFGERIIIPGIERRPDAEEQPFHSLDLVYSWFPDFNSTIKLKVQNILDETKEIRFDNTLLRSETQGVGFSLSYKYEF